jgi:hypothetical protein
MQRDLWDQYPVQEGNSGPREGNPGNPDGIRLRLVSELRLCSRFLCIVTEVVNFLP